ncbi:MAG: hypothetical protein M3O07_03725 [Pseudomonadota bacterium]|nr:hypothetical protein [Pseudomonadota bacterium]
MVEAKPASRHLDRGSDAHDPHHGVLSQGTPREAMALRELRHPSGSARLRSFLIED